MEPARPDGDLAAGRQLVIRAFEQARASGKVDWREMTTAVLKNRLLNLTGGTFDEREWGARSIVEFAGLFPETIELDRSGPVSRVTILDRVLSHAETPAAGLRLRADLWDALFDYRSGRRYSWTLPSGPAVPRDADEATTDPLLPTLSADDLQAWRAQFAESHEDALGNDDRLRLREWRDLGRPTGFLPLRLQRLWNGEIRDRATSRLLEWFQTNELTPPSDIVSRRPARETDPEVQTLRQVIHACVDRMTEQELRSLPIPGAVVLRVVEQRQSRR